MTISTLGTVLVVFAMWVAAWHLRPVKARHTLLLFASYLFYVQWGGGFLAVLIASSLLNFTLGSVLRRRPTVGWLWLGIAFNVLLLGLFKYFPPPFAAPAGHMVMPIGMSFWTLQGLSYLFDIYREEELDPSLLEFCLYMAFWPTVLAGPVCRLGNMLPQFRKPPAFSSGDISAGAFFLIQGLFMKLVLAPLLASGLRPGEGVNAGFDRIGGGWGAMDVWFLGVGFGFQLFFDFAGYSHIMIGAARLFGIRLPDNFDRPFLSPTPSIFWTRWHMSLSFWIRDYVFMPLAAAVRRPWWPYIALIVSMTLFGLWHAATLTFLLWGMYHGVLLVAHRLGQQIKRHLSLQLPPHLGLLLAGAATFLLVALGWVFFRATEIATAVTMFRTVFSPAAYLHVVLPPSYFVLTLAIASVYFCYEAGRSVILSWTARYTMAVREQGATLHVAPAAALLPAISRYLAVLFIGFRETLWWWFGPTVFILLFCVAAAVYEQSAVVPVSPFIYTLF